MAGRRERFEKRTTEFADPAYLKSIASKLLV